MRESDTRAELFAAFHELAEVIPEMRPGQLMAAVVELCADLHGRGWGRESQWNRIPA